MKFATAAAAAALLLTTTALAELRSRALVDEAALDQAKACNSAKGRLTFVVLKDEAVNLAIEDDIRKDLAAIGFEVETKLLTKPEINEARQAGDFHFSISETWGSPYDPHTFASGWIEGRGGEGVFHCMENFEAPASRDELFGLIEEMLKKEDRTELRQKWQEIHSYYHAQAVMLPLFGKNVPTVMNTRLTGYRAGFQQFDYPVHKLTPLTGSDTVTIAPGARSGLFRTVGDLDAHTYGPNEFFSSNWVYEGLVAYGEGGQVVPSLAASYRVEKDNELGGDTITFTLQEGVTFHDGQPWNCAAAKLNFDHVLAGALRDYHGWYGLPKVTEDWFCNNDMEFVIRTNQKHGPFLQELTLIRPIRMVSPAVFPNGNASDPFLENSCNLNWGTINAVETDTQILEEIKCVGLKGVAGTGPFKFDSRETVTITTDEGETEVDNKVVFTAHESYWDGAPDIKRLEVIRYESSEEVKAALLSEELDLVWGVGVLTASDIVEFRENDDDTRFRVFQSDDVQNAILLLNSGQPPFDDINVRKTVIHAINKSAIVRKELQGLNKVVDNVFPIDAPYCDVDLTPTWDYDFEKAVLLSCEGSTSATTANTGDNDDDKNKKLALGLGIGLGGGLLLVAIMAVTFYNRSKAYEQELKLTRKSDAVDT